MSIAAHSVDLGMALGLHWLVVVRRDQ